MYGWIEDARYKLRRTTLGMLLTDLSYAGFPWWLVLSYAAIIFAVYTQFTPWVLKNGDTKLADLKVKDALSVLMVYWYLSYLRSK